MSNHAPAAIFFDLDDTIIDDSSNVESGWHAAVSAFAPAAGLQTDAVVQSILEVREWYWSDPERHRVGRSDLRAASSRIVAEALSRLDVERAGLDLKIADYYRDLREEGLALLPHAVEVVEELRSRGIRLALLTNGDGPGQRKRIARFELGKHFDYICIEGEFGCGKPDERVYCGALDALACEPSSTWMVGDNLVWDVAAPMRLGLTGIWLDRAGAGLPTSATALLYQDSPVKPDRIIRSLRELL